MLWGEGERWSGESTHIRLGSDAGGVGLGPSPAASAKQIRMCSPRFTWGVYGLPDAKTLRKLLTPRSNGWEWGKGMLRDCSGAARHSAQTKGGCDITCNREPRKAGLNCGTAHNPDRPP